jgi:hypothetical protein
LRSPTPRPGVTYTRELPIDYYETAYCLRLTGEGLDGKSASLVFYTDAGLGRLKDLTGGGADHDRCGTLRYDQIRFLPIYHF